MKAKKDKNKEIIIDVKNLNITKNKSKIINNISLQIIKGETTFIIGPNGGGKTTFIKAILGLEKYRGKIEIFGRDRKKLSKEMLEKIGYVPQIKDINMEFPITIEEIVSYMGSYENTEEIMKKFGIYSIRDKRINELSGGQMQRVFIARAFVNDPEIVIFDEPDTALDSTWRTILYSFLNELKTKKKTIILVTHDLTIMNDPKSRVLCLNKHIHIHGIRSEIITKKNLENIYGCPIELIAHGNIPHRVLKKHEHRGENE